LSLREVMTAVWGPMGWMTLHSVSTIYPEHPTQSERDLMTTWLMLFGESITCSHCRDHFRSAHANYRARFPGYLESRQSFAMFAFRVHNVVNARLSKPVYATVEECLNVLRTNIKTRSAADYRISYINHIMRYWATFQDTAGIAALKKALEMKKIEIDYFAPRDTKFEVTLVDEGVVIPRNWIDHQPGGYPPETPLRPSLRMTDTSRAGFRMVGGRIRLF
jgi:hypothetical protein